MKEDDIKKVKLLINEYERKLIENPKNVSYIIAVDMLRQTLANLEGW